MKYIKTVGMAVLVGLFASGCARIQTKVVEKPRVDQELQQGGGNRGYLKGSGPAGGPRSATRQMLETNIELPTGQELNPWRKKKAAEPQNVPAQPVSLPESEPVPSQGWEDQGDASMPSVSEPASVPAGGTEYTVQKGDTLQKIAKKFYGNSKKWYRIYKANKGVLKSADKIRPGQKLTIPGAGEEVSAPEYK